MKMVKRPQELVAAAGLQGVALNDTEAAILLGYLEGHDAAGLHHGPSQR